MDHKYSRDILQVYLYSLVSRSHLGTRLVYPMQTPHLTPLYLSMDRQNECKVNMLHKQKFGERQTYTSY